MKTAMDINGCDVTSIYLDRATADALERRVPWPFWHFAMQRVCERMPDLLIEEFEQFLAGDCEESSKLAISDAVQKLRVVAEEQRIVRERRLDLVVDGINSGALNLNS